MVEVRVRNETANRMKVNVLFGYTFVAYENADGARDITRERPQLIVIEIKDAK